MITYLDDAHTKMIKCFSDGIWIGDTTDKDKSTIVRGNGLFINLVSHKVTLYTNGSGIDMMSQQDVRLMLEDLKKEMNEKIDTILNTAVFG